MKKAASLDSPAPVPRSPQTVLLNRILLGALFASLWFAGIRWLGPWSGFVVSLAPIWFIPRTAWRHLLMAVSVLVHGAWQVIWMF